MSRVLMIIPNLGFGGAQRVFAQHASGLAAKHEVVQCVFNREEALAYPTGLPLEDLHVAAGSNTPDKALKFGQRVARLHALKARLTPDVSISHLEGADYVNVLSARGERVVLCVHGTKLHDANIRGAIGGLRRRVLIPALYRQAHRVVTVSRAIREELVEAFGLAPDRVQAIPNGFEVSALQAAASEPIDAAMEEVFAAGPTIVTAGRFALQKNLIELIEVFARLRHARSDVRLVLVGDGELRSELRGACDRLELSVSEVDQGQPPAWSSVLFLGFQKNPFRFVKRGTLFAMTSGWEGFPMALGEALACGTPVVSVDCPTGPREILSSGDPMPRRLLAPERVEAGVLMPMLDGSEPPRQQWSLELAEVIEDAALRHRVSRAGLERVQQYDLQRVIEQWDAVVRG